jgi:hypothetical protein
MDEMEIAFNKTSTALVETTRIANERDQKQHEKIIYLEKRLEKLQKYNDAINSSIKDLKLQVTLEIIFIIEILLGLLKSNHSPNLYKFKEKKY